MITSISLRFLTICSLAFACMSAQACRPAEPKVESQPSSHSEAMNPSTPTDTATFGGGCYWCVEAVYSELKGVVSVTSGFSGGARPNPSYEQVCSGATGHAEVVQIVYDPKQISFGELLEVFWTVHDPTTLNRQGADVGTQYRSVIFYHNEEQHQLAQHYKEKLNAEKAFDDPVVTEISPYKAFYSAEAYHQEYYKRNGGQPYCQMVIRPKVEKFRKVFHDKLK